MPTRSQDSNWCTSHSSLGYTLIYSNCVDMILEVGLLWCGMNTCLMSVIGGSDGQGKSTDEKMVFLYLLQGREEGGSEIRRLSISSELDWYIEAKSVVTMKLNLCYIWTDPLL